MSVHSVLCHDVQKRLWFIVRINICQRRHMIPLEGLSPEKGIIQANFPKD